MPNYEYECDSCQHQFEIQQSMMDKKLTDCPECGKPDLHRLIGAGSGIIFKGSGFYETDYKRPAESGGKSDAGSSAGTPSASDSCGSGCGCH